MPDAAIIEVAAVILFNGPLMLINRRPEGGYYGGWWEWPGGKCRPGESLEACARRELAEEIGLAAGPLRLLETIEAQYPGRNVRVSFFVGTPQPDSRPRPDAQEHCWVEPRRVLEMKFLEANLPVLRRLVESPPELA